MPNLAEKQLADHMREAIRMSCEHVASGGIPFAALVVHPTRGVLGSGVNRVAEDDDPTAHAEVVAIRNAGSRHGRFALASSTLLASGEPCALCYLAIRYSGITQLRFAVDRYGAAKGGFDYVTSYDIFSVPTDKWGIDAQALPVDGSDEPFDRWLTRHSH
jgi:guanine deaminase